MSLLLLSTWVDERGREVVQFFLLLPTEKKKGTKEQKLIKSVRTKHSCCLS